MAEPKIVVIPNPTAAELFADGAYSVSVRRGVARISFFSDRVQPGSDGKNLDRVVVGHVILPVSGLAALNARIANVMEQMRKAGMGGLTGPGSGDGDAGPGAGNATTGAKKKRKK